MHFQTKKPVEIVKFENVSLNYPTGHPVFYNLNYTFYKGGCYFLTGASGAGKTSLLKLIYSGERATKGQVSVFGKEITSLNPQELPLFRQKMGLVFQDCRLLSHLSALDNVALAMTLTNHNAKKSRAYATELLNWVGLGDHLHNLPDALSDGQKQRVAIARAVITRPLLILADEPTGNVDDDNAYKLMMLFEELNKIGTTIIMATHNRALVSSFNYPELYLHKGQLSTNITPFEQNFSGGHG